MLAVVLAQVLELYFVSIRVIVGGCLQEIVVILSHKGVADDWAASGCFLRIKEVSNWFFIQVVLSLHLDVSSDDRLSHLDYHGREKQERGGREDQVRDGQREHD